MTEYFWVVRGPNSWDRASVFFSEVDAYAEAFQRHEKSGHHGYAWNSDREFNPRTATHLRVKRYPLPEQMILSEYEVEQVVAINQELREAAIEEKLSFFNYEWSSGWFSRGKQLFAIFGDYARELLPFDRIDDEGTIIEYRPVIISGRVLMRYPDEGQSGMLYLYRVLQRRGKLLAEPKWGTIFCRVGWLHTKELVLSPDQIVQNMIDEANRGERPLTGGYPPGWI